jgi:hypothetical protein
MIALPVLEGVIDASGIALRVEGRVHRALVSLPEDQQRLGVLADWKGRAHRLTYRQAEYTFGLVTRTLGKDQPDGLPSPALRHCVGDDRAGGARRPAQGRAAQRCGHDQGHPCSLATCRPVSPRAPSTWVSQNACVCADGTDAE